MMRRMHDLIQFLSLALRNVWRNRRRSLFTMASISAGAVTFILLSGYILVMKNGLKASAIEKEYGHLEVARRGYFEEDASNLKLAMTEPEYRAIEEFLLAQPEVETVVKRLQIVGMIGNERSSTIFSGTCDETGNLVSLVPQITEGRTIDPARPEGIVIGREMARRLKAAPGDAMLLFFASDAGSQEAVAAVVDGLYKGMLREQEAISIYLPLETAWSLMLEKRVHRLIVFLKDERDLPAVTARLEDEFRRRGLPLEARGWRELAVMYRQIINMFSGMVLFAGAIIFIVVIFGISNTMYMAVSDRTQEIGTLRAIGDGRLRIAGMLFCEGLLIGVIGSLIGCVLACALAPVINALHIMLPPGPGQSEPIPVFLVVDPVVLVQVSLVTIACAALASISPSLRALRRSIAEALRYA